MHKIAQGAEAVLYRENEVVIKERLSKGYRLPQIDEELRKFRTRREAKILGRLNELNYPAPRLLDMSDKQMTVTMDFIAGSKLRDVIEEGDEYQQLARTVGRMVGTLHKEDIVHGDLTTSNMIIEDKTHALKLIDFGLSSFSVKFEDKAVDLFLLNRALESKHYQHYPDIFEKVLEGYYETNPEAAKVLERYNAVMKRGRNKIK